MLELAAAGGLVQALPFALALGHRRQCLDGGANLQFAFRPAHQREARAEGMADIVQRRALILVAQHLLGLEEVRQAVRHCADAIALDLAQPAEEVIVDGRAGMGLDLHDRVDDLRPDLLRGVSPSSQSTET
jgi:hypothetical protein